MNKIETGGPAFPCWEGNETEGMTLRDYFAAKAMQAYFARENEGEWSMQESAAESYRMAEAMIKARK